MLLLIGKTIRCRQMASPLRKRLSAATWRQSAWSHVAGSFTVLIHVIRVLSIIAQISPAGTVLRADVRARARILARGTVESLGTDTRASRGWPCTAIVTKHWIATFASWISAGSTLGAQFAVDTLVARPSSIRVTVAAGCSSYEDWLANHVTWTSIVADNKQGIGPGHTRDDHRGALCHGTTHFTGPRCCHLCIVAAHLASSALSSRKIKVFFSLQTRPRRPSWCSRQDSHPY